ALRRLLPYPRVAAPPVVKSLREGNLAVKLAALELLRDWKAPISALDPWRAESLTEGRLAALDKWAAVAAGTTVRPTQLTVEELTRAREEIVAMLRAKDAAVEAVRERLARFCPLLPAGVQARLKLGRWPAGLQLARQAVGRPGAERPGGRAQGPGREHAAKPGRTDRRLRRQGNRCRPGDPRAAGPP